MTSSKISTAPCFVVSSRTWARKSSIIGIVDHEPPLGSRMTPAISPCTSRSSSIASSLLGTTATVPSVAFGIPGMVVFSNGAFSPFSA